MNVIDQNYQSLSSSQLEQVSGGVWQYIAAGLAVYVGGTFVLGAVDGAMGAKAKRRGY